MNPQILQVLDEGACVVTATKRLSYEVKAAYNAYQLELGKQVWPTAKVMTWENWMLNLWGQHSAHSKQHCLNTPQSLHLLGEIIQADLQHPQSNTKLAPLWNIPATATTALEAWQLCHQWHISYTKVQQSEHVDHAHFGRWATQLFAHLQKQQWITAVQITDILLTNETVLPQNTFLFGFDHFNSQQLQFLNHHRTGRHPIKLCQSDTPVATQIYRHEFEDTRAEWRQIGAWARTKLLDNPQLKLAIINPNIDKIHSLASRCLREQLTPQYYHDDIAEPFHFSQAAALASTPLISSALGILELLQALEFKQLTTIFLSHYWGSEAEHHLRAQLIIRLRRHIAYQFDLFQLIQAIPALKPDDPLAALLDKLSQLQAIKTQFRGKHALATWRTCFQQCHTLLGWPITKLDSTEFQALQAWNHCLDDWVKLDMVSHNMTMGQALQSLKNHCQQIPFQAQAHLNAPIQIMGSLEAAELNFDAVWLAGFDQQAWPGVASANPFIPIQIQINAGIPSASVELQAQLANAKTIQLCHLARETHLSHARIEDDIALDISPLFANINLKKNQVLAPPYILNDAIRAATPALTQHQDNIGMALPTPMAPGGTGMIQKQSACPFWAYAQYRLKAGELDEPEIGVNNLDRGSLLHEVLATIWQALQNSTALHQHFAQNTLKSLIAQHSKTPLSKFARRSGLGKGFIKAESKRLNTLILQWLLLEYQRPPFKLAATEQQIEFEINGLKLNFSLDRVDILAASNSPSAGDESRLIIDYKSGKCFLTNWVGARPDQPQIPLYYLALENIQSSSPVEALAFAQVRQDECAFVGISRHEAVLPEVDSLSALSNRTALKQDLEQWPALKHKWQARLNVLAKQIQQGDAHVDPKSPQTCDYCEFAPLCRIQSSARTGSST